MVGDKTVNVGFTPRLSNSRKKKKIKPFPR